MGFFATAGRADAQTVAVQLDRTSRDGSVGLLVPGRGPTFSREEMRRALNGIERCAGDCRYRIGIAYLGKQSLITISGPGYPAGDLLVSSRTRVPGVISIYDVKPTVEALDDGDEPPITARDTDGAPRIEKLSDRLYDLDDSRTAASLALVAVVVAFALIGRLRRSLLFARAALLMIPTTLVTALVLSALEISKPATVINLLALFGAVGALALAALARTRLAFASSLLAIFAVYVVVLAVSTETSSLAVIGPRPENGGRFYGFNNQLETLLLAPALLGVALLPLAVFIPAAICGLVVVGASFAGADGGGILVYAAGFVFLWLALRQVPLTVRNAVLAAAAVIAGGLVLVGIDAALGGESHVTRAVGGGPIEVLGDIGDRISASAHGIVRTWHTAVVIGIAVPALVWLGLRRPRYVVLDALLVALAVSLVVNDAPREVAGFGALSAAALRFWWETAERVE